MNGPISVVGAVIVRDGYVLCAQRGASGKLPGSWEFPGGKVNPDESPRAALEREITEELQCTVKVGAELTTTSHVYEFGEVRLTTFWCELTTGEPRPTEHADVLWLAPHELTSLDWAPADVPAVEMVVSAAHSAC